MGTRAAAAACTYVTAHLTAVQLPCLLWVVSCCCPVCCQLVKLNKSQRALLQSEEGRVAVAFMKELVTINTALKAPPCQ